MSGVASQRCCLAGASGRSSDALDKIVWVENVGIVYNMIIHIK